MLEEYPSISKNNPKFPNYLNFQTLRDIGIAHLQDLSGKLWTDYNDHDPGVTILEVLCYAITDLGYRNNLDIQDLLALNPADADSRENNFLTPDEILTCNPVTDLDLRKRLIDIPGVRNAWLEKVTGEEVKYNPAIYVDYANSRLQYIPPNSESDENAPRLHPRGLYTAHIDLDLEYRKNACGQIVRSWSGTLDKVKAVLCNYRNLCEDIYDIVVLGEEEIALCSDIELEADADAEDVLVEIYVRLQAFLSPRLRFYTLQELLDKGKNLAEIFAGRPAVLHDQRYENERYHSHGFVDTDELDKLTPLTEIHTSDLYQEILKVPGVAAVRKLNIINYINGIAQSQHPWYLRLTKGYSPELGIEFSNIKLFKGALIISTDVDEVKRRYYEQQAAYIKAFRDDYELDLSVPQGSYYNLADHYSIQHDFPLTYGISEDGLPGTASVSRKAQALQLKGYLVFFEQLLANYLAQLAHVRDLFSWEIDRVKDHKNNHQTRPESLKYTYFTQVLDFPESSAIFSDGLRYIDSIKEDSETYRDRRNRFLDHLLGRFAESFADYALLNYRVNQANQNKVEHETEMIHEKAQFLQDYPTLSRDRFRAFNYCNCKQVWDTDNVSGFKKRVSRLLGIEDVRRRDLCHYRITDEWKIYLSSIPDDIVATFGLYLLILRKLHRLALLLLQNCLESSQTYATEEEAENNLEKLLLFALHADFYKRLIYPYNNVATASNCYSYVLVDEKGQVLAENTLRLSEKQKREIALQKYFSNIQFNQNQFKFTVEKSTNGYSFTIKNKINNQVLLRSLKDNFTGEVEAWQSAAALTKHLRYLNRYVMSVKNGDKSHNLQIVDESGKVLAIAPTEVNPFETFKQLNSVEPFLQIEAVTEQTRGHRFRLVDRSGATLLQGKKVLENENEARDRFYRDLLGILDERVIYLTATPDGFGFRVLSRPSDPKSEVAMHPQTYQTATERNAVVNRLFLLVRTARLNIKVKQHYIGQIYGEDGQILLQSRNYYYEKEEEKRKKRLEACWQNGNLLMELAQNSSNFRLIDSENGPGPYGWELTNEGKDKILATHYYTSEEERNQAIKTLQQRIDDEGFHVLEHILLHPKTKEDKLLPIYVNTDDAESFPLTYKDPYSFWISVILPYWPKRFRDIDFRRFVERTLRLEAPAHVALKIAWLNVRQMGDFEVAYRDWLEQKALDAYYGSACDLNGALNRLLGIIPGLRSVYPKGILYDSEGSVTEGQPIIINQTALGTAND